jgi:hypothetical protein
MQNSSDFLVNERASVMASSLERTLQRGLGVRVLDTSFVRGPELYRIAGKHQHLTLAEIWRILNCTLDVFVGSINGEMFFPSAMISEYWGLLDVLDEQEDNPHRALNRLFRTPVTTMDLGGGFVDRDIDSRTEACIELSKYRLRMDEAISLFIDRTVEDRVDPEFSIYVPRIRDALLGVRNTEPYKTIQESKKVHLKGASSPRNEFNDFGIMALVWGVSYSWDVTLFCRDYDYVVMNQYMSDNMKALMERYDFPPFPREASVVRRGKKGIAVYGPARKSMQESLIIDV